MSYRVIPSTRLLEQVNRTDADFARWVKRMVDAGWRFWLGVDGETSIVWRHADEYEARIGIPDSRRYFLRDIVPDPYDILEEIRNAGVESE